MAKILKNTLELLRTAELVNTILSPTFAVHLISCVPMLNLIPSMMSVLVVIEASGIVVTQLSSPHNAFINPRRACAARVTVVVLSFCLSVCLSVTTFSATTRNKTANKRY